MRTQFFFLATLTAGLATAETLTLSQALTLANGNTDEMEIIRERHHSGEYEVESIKSAVYPRVDFSANATHLSASSKSFGPFVSDIPGLPNRFNGQEYGWDLRLNQPLITFGRLGVLIKIARKTLNSLDLQYDLERERYYFDVVRNYAEAASSQTLYQSSLHTLKYLRRIESFMEVERQGGAVSQVDFLRARSRTQLARSDSSRYHMLKESSLTRLKSLLNLNLEEPLEINTLDEETLSLPPMSDTTGTGRKDLEIRKLQEEVAQYWAKYERANLLPAISLNAGISDKVQEYNNPAGADFAGLVSPDYFNYSVGLQLNWTLFDGFATTSRSRQKLAEAKIAQREWHKTQKEVALSQQEALDQLSGSKSMVESARMAREAATTAFKQGERDFETGSIGFNQLLELESEYRAAESNWANAQSSRLMAKATYLIAHGISIAKGNP